MLYEHQTVNSQYHFGPCKLAIRVWIEYWIESSAPIPMKNLSVLTLTSTHSPCGNADAGAATCSPCGDAIVAVIRSGDKYMFEELSEDETEATASLSEVLAADAEGRPVDAVTGGAVPVTDDWREEKIGVGPVEVGRHPTTF